MAEGRRPPTGTFKGKRGPSARPPVAPPPPRAPVDPLPGFTVDPLTPRLRSGPGAGGRYKVHPDDFVVEELPHGCPAGRGLRWLRVERTGWDTPEVARAIARVARVPTEAVGFAGLKDRDARSIQRFTVDGGRPIDRLPSGLRILGSGTTRFPLRPGEHDGNRFTITVRGGNAARAAELLAGLSRFPNRFGPQRVAHGLPAIGLDILMGRVGRLDPQRKRFALIAWQAERFNRVLDLRGMERLEGDLMMEGVATGPLFGVQMRWPRAAARALEEGVLAETRLPPDALEEVSRVIPGERRPLWAHAHEARIEPIRDGFVLHVRLDPGVYATALLNELL